MNGSHIKTFVSEISRSKRVRSCELTLLCCSLLSNGSSALHRCDLRVLQHVHQVAHAIEHLNVNMLDEMTNYRKVRTVLRDRFGLTASTQSIRRWIALAGYRYESWDGCFVMMANTNASTSKAVTNSRLRDACAWRPHAATRYPIRNTQLNDRTRARARQHVCRVAQEVELVNARPNRPI